MKKRKAHIGEVITGDDLRSISDYNAKQFSARAYVAPKIFLAANQQAVAKAGYNYYAAKADAISRYYQLWGTVAEKAGNRKTVNAAGGIKLVADGTAQDFGISCEFYLPTPGGNWINTDYATLRKKAPLGFVAQFYKTTGAGPYWMVVDRRSFGITAKVIKDVPADRVAALDSFHKELQLLKANHNAYVGYLQNLLQKATLTPIEQQSYNRGKSQLDNIRAQLLKMEGVEITFGKNGTIGVLGIDDLVIMIIILAIVASWTIDKITTKAQTTKQLRISTDFTKWRSDEDIRIDQLVNQGKLTQQQAEEIKKKNQSADDAAKKVVEQTQNSKSIFGEIGDLAKWGLLFFVVAEGSKFLKPSKP